MVFGFNWTKRVAGTAPRAALFITLMCVPALYAVSLKAALWSVLFLAVATAMVAVARLETGAVETQRDTLPEFAMQALQAGFLGWIAASVSSGAAMTLVNFVGLSLLEVTVTSALSAFLAARGGLVSYPFAVALTIHNRCAGALGRLY